MFKLVKYELRKQLFTKVILLILLGVLEIGFLIGLFSEDDRVLGTSVGLFILYSTIAILFVAFESVFTFSNDLKTKQSYMLFLTPNSTYKIVGAKVITTTVTLLLTAGVFVATTLLDVAIVLLRYHNVQEVIEKIQEVVSQMFNVNVDYTFVIAYVCYFVFSLLSILVIGMASITLSATFLSNSKLKGFISVVFFFGINFALGKLEGCFIPAITYKSVTPCYYNCLWSAGTIIVFYFVTAFMLDKKVSV